MQVHFSVKRYVGSADAAVITWLGSIQHADSSGQACHGLSCAAAARTRAALPAHITHGCKQWVVSQLRIGVGRHDILKQNRRRILEACGALAADSGPDSDCQDDSAFMDALERNNPATARSQQHCHNMPVQASSTIACCSVCIACLHAADDE